MTRIFCILLWLCAVSTAFPLSITNGNFENQYDDPYNKDILYWYDYGGPSIGVDQGPFFLGRLSSTIFNSKCVYMGKEANTNEDGGNHAYVYQSIGFYDSENDPPVVDIRLDWGLGPGKTGGPMGVTVMILESDGTFVPGEWDGAAHEIYGKPGIREIGRGTIVRTTATGVVFHERFQIDLTSATHGRELFLRFNNYKVGSLVPYVQIDNITLSLSSVVNVSPQNKAVYVPVWRSSSANDLVFKIVDPAITSVDVLLGTEPNLFASPQYKIVENRPVSMGLNTVTLETELSADLNYLTDYYWQILAYESDGMGGRTLKYIGHVSTFKTIQQGPYLSAVSPDVIGVWPGDNVVFTVPFSVSADTFQWYKQGDPNPLVNGSKYSGADSDTLTIYNVQRADEGAYYCVGRETATGLTSATQAPGTVFIKELKSYYPFETTYTVGSDVYTPDVIGGKDAKLLGGAAVVVSPSDPNNLFGGYLALRNPRNVTHTQYAQISDTSVVHYPELTISCWVKPELLDLDYERNARLFDFGQDAQNYFFLTLLRNTNQAYCEMKLANSSRDTEASGDIGYGTKWLYVVLTVGQEGSSTPGKIYINGQYGGRDGLYQPTQIPKPLNYIGKAVSTTDNPPNFNGLIDELKIYNYVKTAEEIAREYMAVRTEVESICDMESYNLADWDYNRNCRIDLLDLAEIAERWLNNYLVYFD